MEIEGYEIPEELCYTKNQLWTRVGDGGDVRVDMNSSTATPFPLESWFAEDIKSR